MDACITYFHKWARKFNFARKRNRYIHAPNLTHVYPSPGERASESVVSPVHASMGRVYRHDRASELVWPNGSGASLVRRRLRVEVSPRALVCRDMRDIHKFIPRSALAVSQWVTQLEGAQVQGTAASQHACAWPTPRPRVLGGPGRSTSSMEGYHHHSPRAHAFQHGHPLRDSTRNLRIRSLTPCPLGQGGCDVSTRPRNHKLSIMCQRSLGRE